MLRDGKAVILLLREHLGTGEMGFEGAGGELVWGNLRRGSHERLENAGQKGVGAGCVGACILGQCLRVPPAAPGGSRSREGLVPVRGALSEPERWVRHFGMEAPKGGDQLEEVHPRVHAGASCANCPCVAPQHVREELVRGRGRGAL